MAKKMSRDQEKAMFAQKGENKKQPSRYPTEKDEEYLMKKSAILRKQELKLQGKKDRFAKADLTKRPNYIGIKWEKHKGMDISPDHIVAKGNDKQMRENFGLVWKEISEDNIYHHKITGGTVKPFFGWQGGDDSDKLHIGDSYYNKAYVYEIIEEITGDPIFYSSDYKVRKSAVGREIRIPVKISLSHKEFPMAFKVKDKDRYYLIAPSIYLGNKPEGKIDTSSKISKRVSKSRVESDELRDFFVQHQNKDGEVNYNKLEKRFGKKGAYTFHERGLIYEPVHGRARMT